MIKSRSRYQGSALSDSTNGNSTPSSGGLSYLLPPDTGHMSTFVPLCFRNQLTEECIEYTLAKRVLHLTPPTLKPVGSRVIQRYSHHKQVTNDAASVEAYLSKAGQMTQRGSKASSPQEWGPTAQRSPQGTLARSPANPAPVYSPSSQGSTISPPKTSQTLQKQTEWSPRSAPSSNSPQNSYQPAVSPSNSRQGNQGASCAIRESADDFEQRDSDVLVESDSDQDSTVWD